MRALLGGFAAILAWAAAAEERPPLLCGGQSPHWSLEIGPETALFAAPGRTSGAHARREF